MVSAAKCFLIFGQLFYIALTFLQPRRAFPMCQLSVCNSNASCELRICNARWKAAPGLEAFQANGRQDREDEQMITNSLAIPSTESIARFTNSILSLGRFSFTRPCCSCSGGVTFGFSSGWCRRIGWLEGRMFGISCAYAGSISTRKNVVQLELPPCGLQCGSKLLDTFVATHELLLSNVQSHARRRFQGTA